jgi:hypothetical protein
MATITILSWKAVGLRCPDHEFSFVLGDGVNPLTLIQMPNGTGKTTTLNLIRAALSGNGADGSWDQRKIRSFVKRGNEEGTGEFRIAFAIEGRRYTVAMRFNFAEGVVDFSTTGKTGIRPGFDIPVEVRTFLRPAFVPFFVFDGELAERLLDSDHTNAREAIEGLFRLDLFETIKRRVNDFWEQQVSQRGASDVKGLTGRRNRLQKLKEREAFLQEEQKKIGDLLSSARDSLKTKRARFNAAIKAKADFRVGMERVEAAVGRAKDRVNACSSAAYSLFRDPHAISPRIAEELVAFKQSLDRVKLPESTAKEFFEELADEDVCVCGRALDVDSRAAIRTRAALYLGQEDVSLLNSIKSDITGVIGKEPGRCATLLSKCVSDLKDALRDLGEKELERDQIRQQAVEADPALEAAEHEITKLEIEVSNLQSSIEKFDDPTDNPLLDDQVWGLKVIERRIKDAERKYAEITQTLQLKQKRDILTRILGAAGDSARRGVCEEICLESNKRIKQLIPDNRIAISRIDQSLHLEGQAGGSVGETLSVAYAFLSTLFFRADNKLPFVVDSPANPIDLRVRAQVAELVPRLSHQFIAFTISSERDGFLAPLEKAAKKGIQYFTMYRKGDTAAPSQQVAARETVVTTEDGIVVNGSDFFHNFHLDSEVKNGG